MADQAASRAALLGLRRDRRVIEEGHRFLDERRVALAHELLRRAQRYATMRADLLRRQAEARRALGDAVGRHGLEGLQAHPAWHLAPAALERRSAPFLGVALVDDARLPLAATADPGAAWTSSEAARCARAWRELAEACAGIAGEVASLLRLMSEYRKTERRVRALENIVLPEARAGERRIEAVLEELDQEEVMRSRLFARDVLDPGGG